MAANSPGGDPFERHLRRVLRAHAESAPMPAGVADIPDRWARAPRRASPLALGGLVAAIATVAVMVIVSATVPRIGSLFRTEVAPGAAAALLGVPVTQVVQTRDGAVAFDIVGGAEPVMLVHLVRHGDEGLQQELLARLSVAPELFDDGSATVWGDTISCSHDRGLEQPNFVLGGGNPPPTYVGVGHASGTAHRDRFFLSVLESVEVTAPIAASLGNAGFTTPEDAFDHTDACRGELIPQH